MTKLHFDGGCRPNPGPIELAVAVRGEVHVRDTGLSGDNNLAEWLALLWAVEIAVARGLTDIVLIGDSHHVIGQAAGRLKCRTDAARACRARYLDLAAGLSRIVLRQVPRARNLAGIALQRRHDRPFDLSPPGRPG